MIENEFGVWCHRAYCSQQIGVFSEDNNYVILTNFRECRSVHAFTFTDPHGEFGPNRLTVNCLMELEDERLLQFQQNMMDADVLPFNISDADALNDIQEVIDNDVNLNQHLPYIEPIDSDIIDSIFNDILNGIDPIEDDYFNGKDLVENMEYFENNIWAPIFENGELM